MFRFKLFWVSGLLAGVAALLLAACRTPQQVVERHYHRSEIDTAAVQAQVDSRLAGWHEVVVDEVRVALSTQQTELTQSEDSRERVTETITTWVDSLGREMRQEQRTTERDISRQQLLREQRMRQEYEQRLQRAVDSLGAEWQERIDARMTHWASADSTAKERTPVGDARPWWQRMRDAVWWMVVGVVVVAVVAVVVAKETRR